MAERYGRKQLIDREGKFYDIKSKDFGKEVEISEVEISYVVSIMGPQSSGKSTLLNHLFGTKFGVMDASKGRKQTTSGIWVGKSGIKPCTLVMDLEGSDGSERGEKDTNFEKWSALFALAMSNIVLINMWCHDVGREQASNKPLLRIVFKAVLRICSTPHKVTLMFVLRDPTKTPLNVLSEDVLKDIRKIWNSIGSGKKLEEIFDVKVEALCNYEEKPKKFKEQVAGLKKKICGVDGDQSNVVRVDRDQRNAVPASVFSENARQIWKKIKEDRNLRIPSTTVLLSTYHCDKIANEKFERFKRDYKAKKGSGKSFHSLRKTYLSEYDKETLYYDKVVMSDKRKELEAKMLLLKEPKFSRISWEKATVVLYAAAGIGTIGIAAAGIAIPGLQGVAVAMIPVVGSIAGHLFASYRRQIRERRE